MLVLAGSRTVSITFDVRDFANPNPNPNPESPNHMDRNMMKKESTLMLSHNKTAITFTSPIPPHT